MNIPDPQTFTDPVKLRKLMANAVRLGHEDLAFNCKLRIAELVGEGHDAGVEREFWTAIAAAEEFKTAAAGKSSKLTKIRAKHKRVGAQRVLADLMMEDGVTEGFDILVANGRGDLTGEAVVLRHDDVFSVDEVNAARRKLMEHGITSADRLEAEEVEG
ncbi:hypothetical protein PSQ90_08010 [Devosia rhodophyticola]|uniref:Terminase small subunit n=1 Tax=Devosia rhodophyticola TaxID=3026423 RepID=A0ABY7Z1D8_9HYPH|nr:hypothetical protein [Devosia rhodophyticola]WDR07351.1 hypothetical protein PSQ90_08010 [Devosia rhodophyticola]